ncbi:multidrug effflux MFS transporter [Amorphus orientalis]|uniref:Bcr/CflA family efflux transporter n=1 Tax=Amorphus orientalis TaxID=649198 RepID=A0AAE3VPP6_9HYPH|nr:multidrug effflux MFS transporter [Amorphus orientalis]MDQ0315817.1 DHA1 family bicyclomycin/chloramphenicol resistance-like MFS transporter [Amorphus orientalis]
MISRIASRSTPPSLFVLIVVSTLQPIAVNMYVPSLPAMERALGTDATSIQLTITVYLAATAIGQLIMGPLSDRFGRRPVLLCGLVLFVAGSLACAMAGSIGALLLARMVQAFGACAGLSLARAIVRDTSASNAAAARIGYLNMGMAIAPVLAPALGGQFEQAFGWRANFDFMAAFGGLVLIYAFMALPETRRRSAETASSRSMLDGSLRLLRNRAFWIYAGTLMLLSSTFFALVSGGPYVAIRVLGLSPATFGLYFMPLVLGYMFGNFVTARFGARIGIGRMITIGNSLTLTGVVLSVGLFSAGFQVPIALFGPLVITGIGNGFGLPNTIAGAVSVDPDLAGAASGVAGAVQVGGGAVATVIVGRLFDVDALAGTAWPMFLPMIVGAVCALILGAFARDSLLR